MKDVCSNMKYEQFINIVTVASQVNSFLRIKNKTNLKKTFL